MAIKPTSYPENLTARHEHDWRAYDDYYGEQDMQQAYFYHHRGREGAFLDALMKKFAMSRGARIIDIGCGNGFYCGLFEERGLRVMGVDRSNRAIQYCRDTYDGRCEWLCDDAFNIGQDGTFDYAFCFWFMYFNGFEKPVEGAEDMDKLMRLLKPGGKLFFLWHSDLTGVRLPPERFSVMNYTIPQLKEFFAGYPVEGYAIDTPAYTSRILGRYAFNRYITRLSCARVYLQASSWKRARLLVAATKQEAPSTQR